MTTNSLYKVWDVTRTTKKVVIAKSLDELLCKARGKLALNEAPTELRVVMEKDGTEIDDSDVLEFVTRDDVLMIIGPGQQWSEANTSTVVNVYADHNGSLMTETDTLSSVVAPSTCTATTPREPLFPISKQTSTCARLPPFSDYVIARLQAGDSHLIWTKMLTEAAHYYIINFPEMGSNNSSGQYRAVGQAVYRAYPSIARDGAQPWSLFTTTLSQKIRHIRWNSKRKSMAPCASSGAAGAEKSPKRFRIQSLTDSDPATETEDYETHVKELAAEVTRNEVITSHTRTLLKSTFRQRRNWITSVPAGNVATILEKFTCFKLKTFIMAELMMMLRLTSLPPVLKRFELVFEAASCLMKKKKDVDSLEILQYIENETSYKHGKGQRTKPVMQIVVLGQTDKVEKLLASKQDAPPKLIAVKKDSEVVNFAIVADSISILLDTAVVEEAICLLLAFYYVVDFDYPRIYSQVLAFFQHVALQQPFGGQKTAGFSQLVKKIELD